MLLLKECFIIGCVLDKSYCFFNALWLLIHFNGDLCPSPPMVTIWETRVTTISYYKHNNDCFTTLMSIIPVHMLWLKYRTTTTWNKIYNVQDWITINIMMWCCFFSSFSSFRSGQVKWKTMVCNGTRGWNIGYIMLINRKYPCTKTIYQHDR